MAWQLPTAFSLQKGLNLGYQVKYQGHASHKKYIYFSTMRCKTL